MLLILSVAVVLKLNTIFANKNPALVERESHQGASMYQSIIHGGCNPSFVYRIFTIDYLCKYLDFSLTYEWNYGKERKGDFGVKCDREALEEDRAFNQQHDKFGITKV